MVRQVLAHVLTALFVTSFQFSQVDSQVFDSDNPPIVYDALDRLSSACSATFNQSLKCSTILPRTALDDYHPSVNELHTLCTSHCLQSLEAFRGKQLDSCNSDKFTVGEGTYNPTLMVDNLIFTYN